MNNSIIHVENLNKTYGKTVAVKDLYLSIERGEIFGLLGPNGAGKSTTILSLLGLTEVNSGLVKVAGYNSQREPVHVKKKVGYLPDQVGFYEDMTGIENLIFSARLNNIPDQQALEHAEELLELVYLQEVKYDKVRSFSRGMKQRLGLADILMKDPEIIIMDEPTLGIDPKGVQELLSLIKQLRKEKHLTVLLSSHHLQQIQSICDRVGLFMRGSLFAVGTVEQLSHELFQDEDASFNVIFEEKLTAKDKQVLEKITDGTVQFLSDYQLTFLQSYEVAFINWLNTRSLSLRQFVKQGYELQDIYERYFSEEEQVHE